MILMNQAMMGAAGPKAQGGHAAAWWLADGAIASSECAAAFDPRSAASLSDSYVNLITPGTLDMSTANHAEPTLDAGGWLFDGANNQGLTLNRSQDDEVSVVIRYEAILPSITHAMYVFGRHNKYHGRYFSFNAAYYHPSYGWEGTRVSIGPSVRTVVDAWTQSATFVMTNSPSMNATAVYVDGHTETSTYVGGSALFYVGHVNGHDIPTHQVGLNGHISHLAVYDVALTEAQALALISTVEGL